MEPGSGISGYSAGIGMEPGLGVGGYSAGVDLTAQKLNNISDSLKREFKNTRQNAAMGIQKKKGGGYTKFKKFSSNTGKAIGKVVKNQLVESGANIACDVLMGNDIKESMQREDQNARQNAGMGIQKKKGGGYSKFKKLCITKSDYSKFKDLCILKYARDYVKEHNNLVDNMQKYFKNSYCKELAIEMVKKTTEAFEKKYGKNDSRSNMNFL